MIKSVLAAILVVILAIPGLEANVSVYFILHFTHLIPELFFQFRIISGNEVQNGEIPFQAHLLSFNLSNYPADSMCGGSIIDSMWILTAAHCLINSELTMINLGGIKPPYMSYKEQTRRRYIHEQFNPVTLENDIALIRLPRPYYGLGVDRVEMAPKDIGDLVGVHLTSSGFGTTEKNTTGVLLKVELQVINNDECIFASEVLVTENTICTTFTETKYSGVCHGDSGGPLFVRLNGKPLLVGVTSWIYGWGCAQSKLSGFVRVSNYRDWIERIIKEES